MHLVFHSVLYQKRYNRDRKHRFKLQQQIEDEYKKHNRLEEILKTTGASETLQVFAGKFKLNYFLIVIDN